MLERATACAYWTKHQDNGLASLQWLLDHGAEFPGCDNPECIRLLQATVLPRAIFSTRLTLATSHPVVTVSPAQANSSIFRTKKRTRHKAQTLSQRRSGAHSSLASPMLIVNPIRGDRRKAHMRTSTSLGVYLSVSNLHPRIAHDSMFSLT
jgi:hypothetical protein